MPRPTCFFYGPLLIALPLVAPLLSSAQVPVAPAAGAKSAILQDKVVAGSPQDFMEVRHVILTGTNEEIGRALATIAKDRYEFKPSPSTNRLRTRSQRHYIERNNPILFDRMRGVAGAFDKPVDDDAFLFSSLWYPKSLFAGCSVAYYPPTVTASGAGIVSRNYDFSTGALSGTRPAKGELASTARPYIIEMYPDRGYASLAIYSYDMLSGVLDGVNSEGLTVALLADDETVDKYSTEPDGIDAVGTSEVQVLRLLLDTCATAEEAKEAILMAKKPYTYNPVHYLIADRHGNGFVWEYSQHRNRDYFIENSKNPLITTNFSLHRHLEGKGPPSAAKVRDVCPRYCTLAERIANQPGKLTIEFIKEAHKAVDIVGGRVGSARLSTPETKKSSEAVDTAKAPPPERAPSRTLWHALYFPNERKMQVSFYLRDEADPTDKDKTRIVRTNYLEFTLGKTKPE